ncbi:hypothetical protein DFH07DRAFT_768452 [Mycena maculata]|uniref:Uncharacterized protein n=1 Tax=Mycena maculata TaxID=230809 RepID=A0AAD7NQB9_9AGAR|nr:hypothetical protein DFH07DRAFT_768452 [Mycena maculata]
MPMPFHSGLRCLKLGRRLDIWLPRFFCVVACVVEALPSLRDSSYAYSRFPLRSISGRPSIGRVSGYMTCAIFAKNFTSLRRHSVRLLARASWPAFTDRQASSHRPILHILVESASLYLIAELILLVLYACKDSLGNNHHLNYIPRLHTYMQNTKQNAGNSREKTPPEGSPSSTKPRVRVTRATPSAAHANKTREELYALSDLDWSKYDTQEAQKHLYAKGYMPKGICTTGITIVSVATILLRIAADTSSVVTADACRAVAVLLESRRVDVAIDGLAAGMQTLLTAAGSKPEQTHSDEESATATADLLTAARVLTATVQEQCEDLKTLTGRLEEGFTEIIERSNTAPEQGSDEPPPSPAS